MLTKIQLKTQKKNDGICCHDNVEFLSIGQKKMTEHFAKLQK